MPAVTAKDLKSVVLSEDRQQLTINFGTKYVGDLEVTLPVAEIDALLRGLSRLVPAPVPQPSAAPTTSKAQPASATAASPAPPIANQVTVTVPKTWLVTADTSRQAVIIVFNHETDARSGYALNTESSQKLATALSKNATTVSEHVAAQPNQSPTSLRVPG